MPKPSKHKRKKSKDQRAGCLLCKPNKSTAWKKERLEIGHTGFGKLRGLAAQKQEINDHDNQRA